MCISRSEIEMIELILCRVYILLVRKNTYAYISYKTNFGDFTYDLNVFKLHLKLALFNVKMNNKIYANNLI